MSKIRHMRKPEGMGAVCNTKARSYYTTATPSSVTCSKCRKALGLGKYDPMAGIAGILKINEGVTA